MKTTLTLSLLLLTQLANSAGHLHNIHQLAPGPQAAPSLPKIAKPFITQISVLPTGLEIRWSVSAPSGSCEISKFEVKRTTQSLRQHRVDFTVKPVDCVQTFVPQTASASYTWTDTNTVAATEFTYRVRCVSTGGQLSLWSRKLSCSWVP